MVTPLPMTVICDGEAAAGSILVPAPRRKQSDITLTLTTNTRHLALDPCEWIF